MFAPYAILAILALPLTSAMPAHDVRGLHHKKLVARKSTCSSPTNSSASSVTPTVEPSTASPSPASSSANPSPPAAQVAAAASGVLGELFPIPTTVSWTTAPEAKNALSLSDATFRPQNEIKALTHTYMDAPDGKYAMQAHYPKSSYNFQHNPQGGFSFYAPGPSDIDLTTAKEATFGYQVYFPKGFQWVKGGKLPGLYGGDSASEAVSCSGGRRDDGCWSARLMWRTNGAGELYTYLPPGLAGNTGVCNIPPYSTCNDVYGASVGRGSYTFTDGGWTTVTQRVRLNDDGKANGELQLWANGKSVINVGGLTLRDSSAGRIYGIQAQTFFGGSDSSYATPTDQDTYFSDFSVAITEKL